MRLGCIMVCLGLLVSACTTGPQSGSTSQAVIDAAARSPSYRPAVDFRTWRSAIAGPPTKVAVLGSPHLSERSGTFNATTLEPLLARLAAFNPAIITHEGLSGEHCELVQRHPTIYPKIFEDYCTSFNDAVKASAMPFVEARSQVEAMLKAWPASPTAS